MKVYKSEFETAQADIKLLNYDDDLDDLKISLLDFIENDVNDSGPGYDKIKKFFNTVTIPICDKRKDAYNNLLEGSSDACSSLSNYVGSNTYLDTDELDSIIANYNSALSSYREARAQYKINQEKEKKSTLVETYRGYLDNASTLKALIDILKGLPAADATASGYVKQADELVSEYLKMVNNYGGFSGNLNTYTYSPSDVDAGGDTTYDGDYPDYDDGVYNINNPLNSTNPVQEMVSALTPLVGLTASQLNELNSGFNTNNNYEDAEDWNTMFVNDLLNSNESLNEVMQDYYKDSEKYPDAYTSASSLMNYSIDNDNISFNWSDSSLEKANVSNDNSYEPKMGDLVFFDTNRSFNGDLSDTSSANRVAVVESVGTRIAEDGTTKSTMTIVEGNFGDDSTSSTVVRRTIDVESSDILGYSTITVPEVETTNNI